MTDSTEYSQGIYGDGAAILKNGQMLTIEEIVSELRQCKLDRDRFQEQARALAEEVERLREDNANLVRSATPQIVDWAYCGMATNGRLKEQWAVDMFREFRGSIKSATEDQPQ